MGLLDRFRRPRRTIAEGGRVVMDDQTTLHLTEFVRTRRGVEAYIESPTSVTEPTLLLVGQDGEWTRRRIPSTSWGHTFAEHHNIPGYDAGVVGYPQRMRDWNSRQKRSSN